MKCKFEHDEDCCNSGSPQYMCKCKPDVCHSAVPMTNAERIDGLDELDPRMRCSVCGSVETPLARHRFCPVCVADMKGGESDG